LSSIRVLIADDFKDWRRQVLLLFQARPEWQIIAEASDGSEAIQKAEELKPDLIVLDIGLPKLNGIEVARRIRQLSPSSKIVFLSQNNDLDVVRAALGTGALGYVRKAYAQTELLPAVDAALRGKQFVSRSLKGYEFTDTLNERAAPRLHSKERSPLPARKGETSRVHEVASYRENASFLEDFARFIETALKIGNPVIVIATETHRTSLVEKLHARGWDIAAAIQQGSYISLDASETLSTFMVNDWPDRARFLKVAGDLIVEAAKAAKGENPRVAACGECSPILWAQGKAYAAIHLEHLWDEIARSYDVDILCGYLLTDFRRRENSHIFERICAEHSAVYSQ
jgi:DNA-binding NarL/FixJ family response regulator